jgi:hypothetical protein
VLIERGPIARMECDQLHRDRTSLVFEEQRQVIRFDIAQLHASFNNYLAHSLRWSWTAHVPEKCAPQSAKK